MLQGEIQGECGVCRKALTAESPGVVMCTKCRALYHPDCWGFNGARCGIYGCGALPKPAPAPSPAHPRAACVHHPSILATGDCVVCRIPLCGACSWT
ncbi:MAG TPA: hypothetical protein VMU54_12360, partial [Planctomycetota bacterium]|nr:hypothetical protein [Planctomycetota bacterium]